MDRRLSVAANPNFTNVFQEPKTQWLCAGYLPGDDDQFVADACIYRLFNWDISESDLNYGNSDPRFLS